MRRTPPRRLDRPPGVRADHHLAGADPHRGRGGDRRRDPRGRAIQARRPSRAHPRATLAPGHRAGNPEPQRIGLSATQRPLDRIATFLVGPQRECEIVDAGVRKQLDLEIVVPVDDMTEPGAVASDPAAPRTRSGGGGRNVVVFLPGAHRSRPDRGVPRPGGQPSLDLAGDLSGAARAGPRPPLAHLRQQPSRRRTPPRQAPQRAPQRPARARASGYRASGQSRVGHRRSSGGWREEGPHPSTVGAQDGGSLPDRTRRPATSMGRSRK